MGLKNRLALAIQVMASTNEDTLVEFDFSTPYGDVTVMAELSTSNSNVLEFKSICVYPQIEGSIPRGTIHAIFRKQVRELLRISAELGYSSVKIGGERVAGSSAANPGRTVTFLRKAKR